MKRVIMFIFGASVGSLATWYLVKEKYHQIASDEISDMRDFYDEKINEIDGKKKVKKEQLDKVKKEKDATDLVGLTKITRDENYVNYSDISKPKPEQIEVPQEEVYRPEDEIEEPFVISPEEFGENEDYDTISLIFHEDGILSDDNGDIVMDSDELIGKDALSSFGEYEDDAVFVRNNARETDYEIILVDYKFSDTLDKKIKYPHQDLGD